MSNAQQQEPLTTTLVRPSPYEVPPPFAAAPPQAQAFVAGETIGRSLRVWWKNIVPFTVMSFVVSAPMAVWIVDWQRAVLAMGQDPGALGAAGFAALAWKFAAVWIATVLLHTIALGAITRGAFGHLRGEKVSFGVMLATGFRRGLPVVGAAFLAWIGMMFAGILLVFPAVMLACAWAASVPAAVVERIGPVRALSRSAELTRGFRWKVLGVFAALFGVVWGLSLVIQLAGTSIAILALPSDQAPLATMIVSQLGTVLFSCIPAVGCAVVYHDLRAAREGLDTEQLASVFE